MDNFNLFLPLSKVEKQADGSRIITGYASTPSKDLDGEIVTINAVKKALPSYMEWRNIRQMHQEIAVGVAKEAHVDNDGLFLRAKIVDPTCVKLIDEEVLKGFSIGGKKLKKVGNEIREIELIEISVVDRPANSDCRFDIQKMSKGATMFGDDKPDEGSESDLSWFRKTFERLMFDKAAKPAEVSPPVQVEFDDEAYEELCKRKFTPKERQDSAAKGHAMPGGGFPIENNNDLRNAIQAFGRAKDKDATKKHIIARAKALGCTDMLPADWEGSTKSEKAAMLSVLKSKSQEEFDWDDLKTLAKSAPVTLNIQDDLVDRLAKGLGTVGDLSYAFTNIRGCQRRLLAEAAIEKDGEDEELARRLGQVAAELASVISQKAEHEASEALYLTDADDLTSYVLNNCGVEPMAFSANTDDLAKRASKAVRSHMVKVKDHLDKAAAAHGKAMEALGKAGQCLASDMGKSAGDKAKEVMGLLKSAYEGFSEAADQQILAKGALSKAASADVAAPGPMAGGAEGHVSGIAQGEMTGGDVPWYRAGENYFASAHGDAAAALAQTGMVSKTEADALVKAAAAEARSKALEESNATMVGLLSKTPSGARKSVVFPVPEKGALLGTDGAKDKNAVLLEGIDMTDLASADSRRKAASMMVSNMVANPQLFAKSVFDPSFRGQAGMKKSA